LVLNSDPYFVPPTLRRPGYVYRYVRKDVRGYNDYNIERAMRDGWKPVPGDRGGAKAHDQFGLNPHAEKFFTVFDGILMERPEIFSARQKEELYDTNEKRMRSLTGVVNNYNVNPRSINNF
jgi:hypothetical protein